MARLVVEAGQEAGMVYPIGEDPVIIGRSIACEIPVMDRRVSRRHTQISRHAGACVIEDLDSRNGTFLNHQPLTGLAQLRDGDRISVGGTVLLFELDPADLADNQQRLRRVRLAPGGNPQLQTKRSIESDTAPVLAQMPVTREMVSDPLQRLRVLYQVSESLRADLEMEAVLAKIMDIIWMVANPDRGIILLADDIDESAELKAAVVKVRDDSDEDIIISEGIVERSIQDKSAILMVDEHSNAAVFESDPDIAGKIRCAICAPFIAAGQFLGALYIDLQDKSDSSSHSFTTDDLDMVSGIAIQAGLALQNAKLHRDALKHQRMERELEIARDIQVNLLPRTYPQVPGADFAAMCLPARQVGGDYYDFFEMPEGKLAVVIGDASGKGVPAAILISTVRASCRSQARMEKPGGVGEIVTALNRSVCNDALLHSFASLFMMVYNPSALTFTYTNAGHVWPILVRTSGAVERLNVGGCLLAVSEDAEYAEGHVQLESGDTLVLYTDGVTDTHNLRGDLYSEERLIDAVKRYRNADVLKIRDSIHHSVVQFRESHEPFDDMTLLIMKIK